MRSELDSRSFLSGTFDVPSLSFGAAYHDYRCTNENVEPKKSNAFDRIMIMLEYNQSIIRAHCHLVPGFGLSNISKTTM